MSNMPERIWAGMYPYGEVINEHDWSVDRGWAGTYTAYTRTDLSDAAIAAARAEGERAGMLKAAEIANAHEKRWNDTAYDRRQNGRDDNFACACASASTHIAAAIRAAAGDPS